MRPHLLSASPPRFLQDRTGRLHHHMTTALMAWLQVPPLNSPRKVSSL